MFNKILIPLDFTDSDTQKRALSIATDLAKSQGAELHAVSVGSSLPGATARSEEERISHLDDVVATIHATYGIEAIAHEIHSVDPAAEIDKLLLQSIDDLNIDLVIMSSHVPGIMEYFFSAHAGYVASHAKVSVFVVR